MDSTLFTPCVHCSRVRKPYRITTTGAYCGNCYRYYLITRPCTDCSRPTRWERDRPEPVCRSCARKRKVLSCGCSRCGKPIERAEAWLASGPICAKCFRSRRIPKVCHYCGRLSIDCARCPGSGIDKPACPGCLAKRLPKCRVCHRRFRNYLGQKEADVCSLCVSHRPPRWHLCSCGALVQNPYHSRCRNCEWKQDILPSVVSKLAANIGARWTRQLFTQYCDELIASCRHPSMLPRSFRSDVHIFERIAACVPRREALTTAALLEVLGPNFHIRHKRINDGLVRMGAIEVIGEYDRRLLTLERTTKKYFQSCEGTWRHQALRDFFDDMLRERRTYSAKGHTRATVPLNPVTIRAQVHNAHRLFELSASMGATSVTAITQHHLDSLLAKYGRATSNSYRRVVRYLNTRTKRFKKLTIPSYRSNGFSTSLGLTERQFTTLVTSLLKPGSTRDLGYSLICLFCVLYAQHPHAVVSSKTSVVREQNRKWQYKPANVWLDVPNELGELIRRWMEHVRGLAAAEHGEWLFPGKSVGQHLGTASLYLWLVERELRPRDLFPTAVSNLIRQGVTEVSVLNQAFGIPTNQANFILKKLLPISQDRAMALLRVGGRHAH